MVSLALSRVGVGDSREEGVAKVEVEAMGSVERGEAGGIGAFKEILLVRRYIPDNCRFNRSNGCTRKKK